MANDSEVAKMNYKEELQRSLTLGDLLVYGLIFMVPVAPFGLYGGIVTASNGMIVLAYLIGLIGMIFTANSYAQMSQAIPVAGSVYSYARIGINESAGFIAGWLILLDYLFVPALLYVGSAVAINEIIPQVPVYVWLLLFIAFNTAVNIRGIEMTAIMNKMILGFQLIVLALFVVIGLIAVFNHAHGAAFTSLPLFNGAHFSFQAVLTGVSIAVLGFLGFDAISTLSEESKGGKKAVGKATLWSLVIIGAIFIIQTWVASMIAPNYAAFKDPATAFYQIAHTIGGSWLETLTILGTAISWGIAAALVSQTAIARILFSMSRDKKLPGLFSKVSAKYKTPYASTLFVGILSVVLTLFFQSQFGLLTSLVNFGAISSFIILHVATINYFIHKHHSKAYWAHLMMPAIGFIIMIAVWAGLDMNAKLFGLSWLVIGIIYAVVLKVSHKDISIAEDI
ncbi:MAG: APC family permease [Sporolactobacillus sp.]